MVEGVYDDDLAPRADQPTRLVPSVALAADHVMVVRTLTPAGAPVGGMGVFVSRVGWQALLGETDDGGELAARLMGDAPVRLVARGPGHASAATDVDPRVQQRVDLVLQPAGSIAGSVRWCWGPPVGEGIVVQALESGHLPDPGDQDQTHRDFGRIHSAKTAGDGTFRIHGLDPARVYSVSAASKGILAPEAVAGVRPGSEPIEVSVGRVFAAVVQLREPDGGPLRAAPSLRYVGRAIPAKLGRRFGPAREDAGPLDLADLRELPADDLLLLYVAREDVGTFGPVEISVAAPGYQAVRTTLKVPLLTDPVETVRLSIRPEFERTGELHVLFFGGPPSSDRAVDGLMSLAPVWLVLDKLDAGHAPVRDWRIPLEVWPRQGEVVVVPDIPSGSYRITLESEHQLYGHPSRGVDGPAPVFVDGKVPVTLDCPLLGNLVVSITWPDGSPYNDAAVVHLTDLGRGASGSLTFNHGPYLIDGLLPAEYEVRVHAPFPSGSQSPSTEVRVDASLTAMIDIQTRLDH